MRTCINGVLENFSEASGELFKKMWVGLIPDLILLKKDQIKRQLNAYLHLYKRAKLYPEFMNTKIPHEDYLYTVRYEKDL